jgi:hypothetical protein
MIYRIALEIKRLALEDACDYSNFLIYFVSVSPETESWI